MLLITRVEESLDMNCKGCMYEKTDTVTCAKSKLKGAWNNLLKEIPVLRRLAVDYSCPFRRDGYELAAQKEMNRDEKHSN